jgi:hypothetical protein
MTVREILRRPLSTDPSTAPIALCESSSAHTSHPASNENLAGSPLLWPPRETAQGTALTIMVKAEPGMSKAISQPTE